MIKYLLVMYAFAVGYAISLYPINSICSNKQGFQKTGVIDWELWTDGSQATDGKILYCFKNDTLCFHTEAGTLQRPKLKTINSDYSYGHYKWRIYVPKMGMNEKVSIGAFLYNDDTHEIDFEIGSGTSKMREQFNAKDDEVLMYLTSQGNPWHQHIVPIKYDRWYDLGMIVSDRGNKQYDLTWTLNDNVVDRISLNYGDEIRFSVFCSLENLHFIGDSLSSQKHFALFEKVKFEN